MELIIKKQEFYSLLEELFELDEGIIKGDEKLEDLPFDSLAVVSLISTVDSKLDIVLMPADLGKASSVSDLLAMVSSKIEED